MKHLTTDELVDRLYGVGSNEHLDQCEDCAERFRELGERRAIAVELEPVPHEFLAAQRRSIYARMSERPQARLRWVPALAAAAFLIVVGVVSHHPAVQVVKPQIAEAQLFSDVYSMEQSTEPLAARPIHAIFEQDQQ